MADFKVGDRIRLKVGRNSALIEQGTVAKVIEIDKEQLSFHNPKHNERYFINLNDDRFELAKPKKKFLIKDLLDEI